MRTTKTILAVVIVIMGIGLASCGSDISGGVSLADAREECNAFKVLSEGQSLSDSLFNAGIVQAEAFRDDGGTQSFYIMETIDACGEPEVADTDAAREQCIVCVTSIAAAVWP